MPRRKILFTSSLTASFILEDVEILREYGNVTHLLTRSFADVLRIPRAVLRADITYTWFASTYAFAVVLMARLLGKPSVVILAGVDVNQRPAIGYGLTQARWKRWLLVWTLRNATRLLPVDASLRDTAMAITRLPAGKIMVLPTGYDESVWTPGPKEPGLVLTIAGCDTEERMKVKGIDHLLAAAAKTPGVRFVVIGLHPSIAALLEPSRPPNVELLPPVGRAELLPWYQRASVYCQPSLSEGLPNALCEAMLCGCIPVGTNVGGIPGAIGEQGFVVPAADSEALAAAVQGALQSPAELRTRARARIGAAFPLTRRRQALALLLGELCP